MKDINKFDIVLKLPDHLDIKPSLLLIKSINRIEKIKKIFGKNSNI